MRKRRFISTSDEEEEEKPKGEEEEEKKTKKKQNKKKKKLPEEEEEGGEEESRRNKGGGGKGGRQEEEVAEPVQEDAKPIGEIIRTSVKGRAKRNHFSAFEFDGNRFELDIAQARDGSMMVTGQWFYRPEEAEKSRGGSWEARDTRELFYSFHRDEVPAESVMHKCVVHFVPLHKQLPLRSQHPGFIVQKVYDTVERKLWKLTDKDYEDSKQHEIDLLVQQTRERIGELPDIEPEDASADQDDALKFKRNLRKKTMSPIDVTRDDETTTRQDQMIKAETPGSCTNGSSEFYTILANFKALTGVMHRDKCLEKLLQGVRFVCNSREDLQADDKEKGGSIHVDHGSQEKSPKDGGVILWPDAAVQAVTALEKASYDSLGLDFQKYNQKMRQLLFNLQRNELLARRLVNKELEPSVILNMSPNELKINLEPTTGCLQMHVQNQEMHFHLLVSQKNTHDYSRKIDGLTSEEKSTKEPEESESIQMTDARCSRCTEKKVGVADIIQAGGSGSGDRYLLQCIACGNTWYASRDEISSLTIDAPSVAGNVGTAPWATAKFEAVEKKLVSPRESDKPAPDIFQKTTAAYMPVLETQKSFNRSKTEEPPAPAPATDPE
ncbi:uncharacterized protein LOC131231684 isoform X2 [Magnolia sinica]|uniref:uncharacterized protein LOC131231684 isoform X2 n=1 Tax=Magnolia sinica TaxID=86752 RepID=UPI00265962C1|nr:uncharacterized protein LOC131231684 isoform X2 [Magnolia sinica]